MLKKEKVKYLQKKKKKIRKLKSSLFKNTSIFGLRSGIKSMIIKFTNNKVMRYRKGEVTDFQDNQFDSEAGPYLPLCLPLQLWLLTYFL